VGELQAVLSSLLSENVPVRNLTRIIEAVTAKARETRQPEALVEAARAAIGPVICEVASVDGELFALTFEPSLEQALLESVKQSDQGSWLAVDGSRLAGLLEGMSEALSRAEEAGYRPVIVCAAPLRPAIRRMVAASRPDLAVISYAELSRSTKVGPVGEISLSPVFGAAQ
jgi:flagellar biosynthesis protein FlhA